MSEPGRNGRRSASPGWIRTGWVAALCLLRSLPLFVRATPRTPLRVLGVVAIDTLHVLRCSTSIPADRIRALALFIDFEGCANAAWDHKQLSQAEYQKIRQQLEAAGQGICVATYLEQLGALESRRPGVSRGQRASDQVRSYREQVARLSMAAPIAIALHGDCRDDTLRGLQCDSDVDTLTRILLQCQIIDDVLDFAEDRAARLPSFLNASAPLAEALDSTARAACEYGAIRGRPSGRGAFPFRMALVVLTAAARGAVRVARWRYRHEREIVEAPCPEAEPRQYSR